LDSAFYFAAESSDVAAMERLAAEGASPSACNISGIPAVVIAIVNGRADVVRLLARLGADLDAMFQGQTALMVAVDRSCSSLLAPMMRDCVRALLEAGADRHFRSPIKGITALDIIWDECWWSSAQYVPLAMEVVALLRE
jgi:ankyrin repeat protein